MMSVNHQLPLCQYWQKVLTMTMVVVLAHWCVQMIVWCGVLSIVVFSGESLANARHNNRHQHHENNHQPTVRPRIVLALSGGGARGFAHIGVLKALEEAGIPIDGIAGTSIGAIVGGLYATGYSAQTLDSLLKDIDWVDITQNPYERDRSNEFLDDKIEEDRGLINIRFTRGSLTLPEGISRGLRLSAVLNRLIWNAPIHTRGDFSRLYIPFRAVATDIVSGSLAVLHTGSLSFALRASANVPLRFTPMQKDSLRLVDGGILSNLPVGTARAMQGDIVIAIDISSPLLSSDQLVAPWKIADQIVTSVMRRRTEEERSQADVLIVPDIGLHSADDFSRFDTLIHAGYTAAYAALPAIRSLITQKQSTMQSSPISSSSSSLSSSSSSSPSSLDFLPWSDNTVILLRGLSASLDSMMRPVVSSLRVRYRKGIESKKLVVEIQQVFRRYGYAMAHIKHIQTRQDTLNILCDEGIIQRISIKGNASISDDLLTQQLGIMPGNFFLPHEVSHRMNILLTSGLYSDIQVYPSYTDTSGVLVQVAVRERGAQYLRLGTRLDNERNFQIGIDIGEERLLGTDIRAVVRFAGGLRNQLLQMRLAQPSLLQSDWGWTINGYASRWNFYQYEQRPTSLTGYGLNRFNERVIERYGARGAIQKQLERAGYLSAGMRIEEQRVYNLNRVELPTFRTINTIQLAARFDTQDRADFPSGGRVINLSLEVPLASDKPNAFSKAMVDFSSIGRWGVHQIRPRLYFGFADATLPEAEWFSLGGEDLFYGMREDEMRGRQVALAQVEYQVRLPWSIGFDSYCVVRYDIGSAWESPENIRVADLRHGIGMALRWDTPLGPAAFSLGQSFYFAANPNRVIHGPLLAYFSVGFRL